MKKLVWVSLSIVLLAGLIIAGCAPKAAGPSGIQEIRMGCCTPLTGPSAGFGVSGGWGAQAAVDDLNKLGGIYVKDLGKKLPVKLTVVDNESDPTKAGTLTEALVNTQKVNCLVPPNQILPLDIPMAVVADKYKIPQCTGGNPLEPWLGIRNSATPPFQYTWTFSMAIAEPAPKGSIFDQPGYTVMEAWKMFLDKFGDQTNKKVALFASDEPDGRGWYEAMPIALKSWGYTPIGTDKLLGLFPPDTSDFSSIVTEWKANDCDILWGNCVGPVAGVMLRQCSAMGFQPKIQGLARAALFYEDVSAWGGDLPNGVGVEIWWDPAMDTNGIGDTTPRTLTDRYLNEGHNYNPAIETGYDPVQLMSMAIEKAGSLDPEKIQSAWPQLSGSSIGRKYIEFDENQLTRAAVSFGQWMKVDKPYKWECKVVFSVHDFFPVTAAPMFPIPYD
jgi:branched-chain amino acid transport system substrate-binding protein